MYNMTSITMYPDKSTLIIFIVLESWWLLENYTDVNKFTCSNFTAHWQGHDKTVLCPQRSQTGSTDGGGLQTLVLFK